MLKKGGPKIAAADVSVAEMFLEMFEKNFFSLKRKFVFQSSWLLAAMKSLPIKPL